MKQDGWEDKKNPWIIWDLLWASFKLNPCNHVSLHTRAAALRFALALLCPLRNSTVARIKSMSKAWAMPRARNLHFGCRWERGPGRPAAAQRLQGSLPPASTLPCYCGTRPGEETRDKEGKDQGLIHAKPGHGQANPRQPQGLQLTEPVAP